MIGGPSDTGSGLCFRSSHLAAGSANGQGRKGLVFSDIVEKALGVVPTAGKVIVTSCAAVSFPNGTAWVLGASANALVPGSFSKRACNSYLCVISRQG